MRSVLWFAQLKYRRGERIVDREKFALTDLLKCQTISFGPYSSLLLGELAPRSKTESLFDSFTECA